MKIDYLMNKDMKMVFTPQCNPIDNFNEAVRTYDMKVNKSSGLHLKRIPKFHEPQAKETQISMENLYTSLKPKKNYDSIFKMPRMLKNASSQKVLSL